MTKKTSIKQRITFLRKNLGLICVLILLFFIFALISGIIRISVFQPFLWAPDIAIFFASVIFFFGIAVFYISAHKDTNRYFWLAVCLSLSASIFLNSLYSNQYKTLMPAKSEIYCSQKFQEPACNSYLSCASIGGKESFVVNDVLICGAIFKGASIKSPVQICNRTKTGPTQNCYNITDLEEVSQEFHYLLNSKVVECEGVGFMIDITETEEEFNKEVIFFPEYLNTTKRNQDNLDENRPCEAYLTGPKPVSYDSYIKDINEREREKITLIALLLSISVFSIFSAVSNLKEIIEGGKKHK